MRSTNAYNLTTGSGALLTGAAICMPVIRGGE